VQAEKHQLILERIFGLAKAGTDLRTELVAGMTTFLTMIYIVFVNPQILGNAGMDKGAVFVATCIAAAASTAVMALYANYPIALAPGMGLNAFFAFTVVLTMKYSWQQALAAVFCSGVIFFLISIFRIREYIIDSIPRNLKLAISAGIGLFLGIIALEESKIVVANPATLVTLGDLRNPAAMLCLLGLVLITALNYRRVVGGTLIGIFVVTAIGIPFGLATYNGVVSAPPSLKPTLLQLDFSRLGELSFAVVIFSFLFVDVFDNAGTLIGVTHRAGLTDAEGNLPRMKQALLADSFAAMFGALIGTSTTTSYIESAAGCCCRRTHRSHRAVRRGVFPGGAVLCAACEHGARLCLRRGIALCRLRHGARPGGDRLVGHHGIHSRGNRRSHHASDLFDRDRHRPWLYYPCFDQTDRGQIRRRQARGAGAGAYFRAQIRARLRA
jgi:AGZA family xanthine/uracil permease-like MFS transporter